MVSVQSSEKIRSRERVKLYDFDPDSANAVDVAWVDMRDFNRFMTAFFRTIGTGDLDTFAIVASESPTGAGTPVVVKTKTLTGVQPNAVGDYSFLEVTAEEVRSVDTAKVGLRYVSVRLEFATNTDEGVALYVLADPRFEFSGLTADNIS